LSEYHSKYWAFSLSLKSASDKIENLSRSIANASVDLNPHQVRAALFALQSPFPLSRGVILADEVGLGKTIEAGLVIAQRWAEKKRKILLIVPAFLRKQWEIELREKFYLPSRILDSKTVPKNDPFNSSDEIVICSYQFAAQKSGQLPNRWDLVVIDEAHRMRNVYKNSNKQAKAIAEALKETPKLLLTATPLQNNLMELYGLVSVIDPYVFGDEATFKDQFISRDLDEQRSAILKKRLEPLIIRTLRKQVQEYIPFTKRIPLTHKFTPTDDEQRLYEAVSAYLQRKDLAALPNSQRQLITLVLRRLLASSSFAITDTLKSMIRRLDQEAGLSHILEEMDQEMIDSLDEEVRERLIESLPDPEMHAKKEKMRQEAQELRSYVELAEKIRKNTKGETLLIALEEGLKKAIELGAAGKAVIFTESRRTQAYLYEHLSANGYQDQIIQINGSNSDTKSKAIYEAWMRKESNSFRATSKSVDMKAALVDAFREQGTILLATEAAAEGLNLQFCSIVVNYDLPWNPQRVEQRIGRCHRYGQKHDVVVVNFVNMANEADQRVFELLNEKFKLFDGVFGASDEILGAIVSGVDIELRIHQVYQTCRSPIEIQEAFDHLRKELEIQIEENIRQTKTHLLDHFDQDVADLLKLRNSQTELTLSKRDQWLLSLLSHELGVSLPKSPAPFVLPGSSHHYTLNWQEAQKTGARFLREDDSIIESSLQKALNRQTPPAELWFDYTKYPSKLSLIDPLIGKTGWLGLWLFQVKTFEEEQFLLFAGSTDDGISLDHETCEKIFNLSAKVHPTRLTPPSFESLLTDKQKSLVSDIEKRAGSLFEKEVEKLDDWADDFKERLEKEIKTLDKEIREKRKEASKAPTLAEKLQIQQTIRNLEKQRAKKRHTLFEEEDRIDAERDQVILTHSQSIQPQLNTTPLFQVRFKII
jgi:adenine-specific DNA-methyltransferase